MSALALRPYLAARRIWSELLTATEKLLAHYRQPCRVARDGEPVPRGAVQRGGEDRPGDWHAERLCTMSSPRVVG
jgi:hypothetical protein